MTANELRSKYIEFFKSKNHVEISGQSLIPENDPSVLFTTAGMHPLVPYLLGEKHPAGTRLTDYQKCIRTGDIDEVGDPSHLTCFEMLGNWSLLPKKNVDTGMGLERTNCILQGKTSVYLTEVFQPIIAKIEELSSYKYGTDEEKDRSVRIIADHSRSAVFILGDQKGVSPSNVGAGYVLRRLIRRAVRHGMKLGIEKNFLADIAQAVIENFKCAYPELEQNKEKIFTELSAEENKFRDTLRKGEAEFQKLLPNLMKNPKKEISGKIAFRLYDTFGFPLELTQELGAENGFTVDVEGFKEAERKHQEASKTQDAGAAKGGLAEQSDTTTKYHTATHLLQQSLVNVLGDKVAQKGSNITNERMRFDFTFDRPMTKEEIQKVEDIVNEQIKKDLPVTMEVMPLEKATAEGARALFTNKYGEDVKVYTIGEKDNWFSKEVCGGPHVQHTAQIGEFKIQKEQSSSAGVRRIRAVISGGLPLEK